MSKLIDLSHTIEDGLMTYKGFPAAIVCDYLTHEESQAHYAEGTSFQIGKIEMVGNSGTYLDSPYHRYADLKDISELPLESVVSLDGVKVTIPESVLTIDESHFKNVDVKDKAVLIHTNWSRHWNTDPYYENHPHLNASAAEYLKQQGANLVGIDSYNIDDIQGKSRPVHSILLGADILIVEHMCNLAVLPSSSFSFSSVPVKVKACGTFPVRAFAQLP